LAFSDIEIVTKMAKDYPDFFKVFSTEKHTERMVLAYS